MTSSTFSRSATSARFTEGRNSASAKGFVVRWTWAPMSRFCSTVACSNSSMFWKVRAMPRPATRCAGSRVISSPSSSTRPAVGL